MRTSATCRRQSRSSAAPRGCDALVATCFPWLRRPRRNMFLRRPRRSREATQWIRATPSATRRRGYMLRRGVAATLPPGGAFCAHMLRRVCKIKHSRRGGGERCKKKFAQCRARFGRFASRTNPSQPSVRQCRRENMNGIHAFHEIFEILSLCRRSHGGIVAAKGEPAPRGGASKTTTNTRP